jgi:hypothetical protein
MSLIAYIRDLDRKFAWSFLGVLLALLFGGITIQREFFSDSGPRLRYDILTNTPVLDVREDVSKLSVLFDGIDIRQQKKSLLVITVRVVNDSEQDILKAYYDEAEPLGLSISSGRIIRSDLVTASNPYLERQLVPQQQDDTKLVFPSVILESQEYFVVKLLVLHGEGEEPVITPIGKIAGVRTIRVAEAYKQEARPPFLVRTFAGGIFVQVLRLLSYSIGMIVVLVLVIAPIAYVGSRMSERKKRKIVQEFKQTTLRELRDEDEFFFKTYVHDQGVLMLSMLSLISDPKTLETAYARHEEYEKREKHPVPARPPRDPYEMNYVEDIWFYSRRMNDYLKSGLVKKTDDGLVVDEHMKGTLEEFVAFLKKKNLLPERDTFLVANRELAQSDAPVLSEETESEKQGA